MKHTYTTKKTHLKERIPKPSIFLKLFSFVIGKRVVRLTSYDDRIFFSYIRTGCACGKLHCFVYWTTRVGDCILNEDGKVDRESDSQYIYYWEEVI